MVIVFYVVVCGVECLYILHRPTGGVSVFSAAAAIAVAAQRRPIHDCCCCLLVPSRLEKVSKRHTPVSIAWGASSVD